MWKCCIQQLNESIVFTLSKRRKLHALSIMYNWKVNWTNSITILKWLKQLWSVRNYWVLIVKLSLLLQHCNDYSHWLSMVCICSEISTQNIVWNQIRFFRVSWTAVLYKNCFKSIRKLKFLRADFHSRNKVVTKLFSNSCHHPGIWQNSVNDTVQRQ